MTSNEKANAALFAALIFLVISSCAAYFAFSRLKASENWVHHTHEVESALAQFSMDITRAGRTRSEFADTGSASTLQRHAENINTVRNAMAAIDRLTADNPRQQSDNDRLNQLSEQRIALMNKSIDLKRSGESTLVAQAVITRQIVEVGEQTDTLLRQMFATEERLLAERQQRVRTVTAETKAILITSLFLTLVLFLIHHQLLMDQVRARARAELTQRALSARVLALQDQERRRFARELHDSVGQHLAALKMAISLLQSKLPGDPIVQDCLQLLDNSISETRTISHLLHPPLLDEAGLNSALRWFVEGFAARSGIAVNLEIEEGADRMPDEIELVLFRMVQESLTNVHRHSGTARADVCLARSGNQMVLRVKDYGRGIPPALLQRISGEGSSAGVGLAGMAERVREIGGQLEINSGNEGTEVVARVPVRPRLQPEHLPETVAEVKR